MLKPNYEGPWQGARIPELGVGPLLRLPQGSAGDLCAGEKGVRSVSRKRQWWWDQTDLSSPEDRERRLLQIRFSFSGIFHVHWPLTHICVLTHIYLFLH